MMKTIFCFVLCVFGYVESEAQTAVVDSLRSLAQKINSIPQSGMADCDSVDSYKNKISKIEPATFGNALTQFISANSMFIKANASYCPALKIISNLDSMLKYIRSHDHKDSVQILKAIMYVKARIKGSDFVGLKLLVLTDKNEKIRNPVIALKSFEPSIILPGNISDSILPGEINILRGIQYALTVTDSGYIPYRRQLSIQKDTVLTIILSAISAGVGATVTPCPPIPPPPPGHSYWWIPAVLLGLVLVALVWKILSGKKKQDLPYGPEPVKSPTNDNPDRDENSRKLKESISQLNDQIKEKDTLINKYAGEIAILHTVPKSKGEGTKYFLSELMMTAGPRKKHNEDKDLGEDVCGFVMVGDEVLVWLLDGSSDFYCLRNPETQREYFSSRLLAQCIARELKSHFGEGKMEVFDKTMVTILSDVKSDWLEAIHLLPESEKAVLKSNIKSGNIPECAATVLIGRLSLNGELIVYRSGDSKMLVYEASGGQKVFLNTTLSSKNASSNDRVFFRMMLTEQGELDIHIYTKLFEIVKLENIQTIIGMSDGIGNVTVDDLKKEYPINSDAMRNEIIYQLQGTQDDKSLYIIEIKE
jgi:hypothetical protein